MDEKGRVSIFGLKINIIDLAGIIIVILIVVGTAVGIHTMTKAHSREVIDKVKYEIKTEETARIEKEFEDKRKTINELERQIAEKKDAYVNFVETQKVWQNGFKEGLKSGYTEGFKDGTENKSGGLTSK